MIVLEFPGMKPAAKARPRYDGRGGFMHMPQPYIDWKRAFVVACCNSSRQQVNAGPVSFPCAVSVVYRTPSGNMRPDVDNAAGAVLDALQDADVIANDSQVRRLLVEVIKAHRSDVGITVTITPL